MRSHHTSLFVRRGRDIEFWRAGNQFARRQPGGTLETARIVNFYADGAGIPHVRYQLSLSHPHRERVEAGSRCLALKAFSERYARGS